MKRANLSFSILPTACFVLTSLGCMKTDSLGLAGNVDASAGKSAATGGATALPVGGNELTQTGGATASGGTGGTFSLLDMLPADNEVGTWVQTGGVELITDETGLYNRIDGAAPKYIDRGWVSSVYVNYSQGSRVIPVAIHDMGTDANAQAIYNYSLPPAPLAIPGLANAVVDMGITSGYSAYAYLDRFYIELNISEKDAAALTAIESFMSDILNLISKNRPYVSASDGGSNATICQVPTTTPGPFLLTFELRNSGTAPVFLHTGCSGLTFDVLSCTTGYTENVAGPVFCPCLCGGTGCPACGVCAPDAGVEVSSGETTQWPWDASQLVQQPGQSCLTRVGLSAGQYRVGLQVYATAADAAVQANPLRTLTVDFPLSSTTTVVEIVDGAADDGTCPLLFPSELVHFPSETDSPCPVVEPPNVASCLDSLAGVTCAYPSSLSPGVQDIWTCDKGLYANPWLEYQRTCKRTGGDCLVDADYPGGLSGARIQRTSSCASRPVVNCLVIANDTVQTALDSMMRTIASNCLESTGATTGGALSVFFDGDCPTSFVVDPTELADCVGAQLESERLDCASGLVCGASDYVGLGCGDCR